MLHRHGMLFGVVGEVAMVFPREQGVLSGAVGEVFMEGEVPHEVSVLSGTAGEVSVEKGVAIPLLGREATGDGKGLWKTMVCRAH